MIRCARAIIRFSFRPGWEYKVSWLNHPEVKPTQAGNNSWQWAVKRCERAFSKNPSCHRLTGVAGQMIVVLLYLFRRSSPKYEC